MGIIILIVIFGFLSEVAHSLESYGTVQEMIEIESKAVSLLENYLISTKENLKHLEKKLNDFKAKHNSFKNQTHSNNSLEEYLITRQLTEELNKLEDFIFQATTDYEDSMDDLKESDLFPTESIYIDLKDFIIKLQNRYLINAKDLVSDLRDNKTQPSLLSANDLLELAKHAFENFQTKITEEWLIEFEERCTIENCEHDLILEALEYKSYTKYLLGDLKTAIDVLKRILFLEPSHPRAKGNLEFLLYELNHVPPEERSNCALKRPHGYLNVDELYSFTCRGVIWPDIKITSQLKCRYVHNNIPFLRISPIKEEEVYPDPRITVYKNAIYDSEIEILKNLSYKKIAPSQTVSGRIKARVSKQAWLYDQDHEVVERLTQRVSDITKLQVAGSSEAFQVVNYGIGGHYVYHHDYLDRNYLNPSVPPTSRGDRIATLLFYLNDVAMGGGTAFPLLKVLQEAEKGSAIFWFNLDLSGDVDNRTLHAGCPVLQGQKWIANKWIAEEGQAFLRPCPSDYKKYDPLPEYKENPQINNI